MYTTHSTKMTSQPNLNSKKKKKQLPKKTIIIFIIQNLITVNNLKYLKIASFTPHLIEKLGKKKLTQHWIDIERYKG